MKNSRAHKTRTTGKNTERTIGKNTGKAAHKVGAEASNRAANRAGDKAKAIDQSVDVKVDKLIKTKGLRSTPARRTILAQLIQATQPLAVDELLSILHKLNRERFDVVTLYRNMKSFEQVGLITGIDLGTGKVFYEYTEKHPHHHHHIVCERCKFIRHLDVCGLDAHFKMLEGLGYSKVKHKLEFTGICAACSE